MSNRDQYGRPLSQSACDEDSLRSRLAEAVALLKAMNDCGHFCDSCQHRVDAFLAATDEASGAV